MFRSKKKLRVLCACVASFLAILFAVYLVFYALSNSSRRLKSVAVVGFFGPDARMLRESGEELGLRIELFSRAEFIASSSKNYDAILVRTIGLSPESGLNELSERLSAGEYVVPFPAINELYDRLVRAPEHFNAQYVGDYLTTLTPRNARAFWNVLKRDLWNESVEPDAPEELAKRGFFYQGLEVQQTYDEWLKRADIPKLPADAPRAALIGSFLNPYKSGPEPTPLTAIVEAFAKRGIRAVPILGFRNDPKTAEEVAPDLIVAFPLGSILPSAKGESTRSRSRNSNAETQGSRASAERERLGFTGDEFNESAEEFFSRLDVPMLTAVSLSVSEEEWLATPTGMTSTYQNLALALPELEGAIESTPVSAIRVNEDGYEYRAPIVDRIERLADRARRWIDLRQKTNSEKKLAIVYRRSPGAAPITAQSLEATPSLYHFLLELRKEGYDLGSDFPASYEEFAETLDKRGRTIGQWAPGAFRKFLEESDPERVDTALFLQWAEKNLSKTLRDEAKRVWGAAPGPFFTTQKETGESCIVVSRARFGNVVLMPQPTTEIINDDPKASDFDSVHGTNKAVPYFYQAAYLWLREGFGADAILHFGTHGALEFTRGKPILLSERDWPDALIGDLPSVYLYSINNVGEGLLARRRIRATLTTHMTPPMMKAGVSDENAAMTRLIDAYESTDDEALREQTLSDLEKAVVENRLTPYEPIDRANDSPDKRVEFYRDQLERLRETDVSDGLHVLGRVWTDEQFRATADAIGEKDAEEKLRRSVTELETARLIGALSGRFVPGSTGGDPIVNPDSIPTGRNMAGINIEQTPDSSTFELAKRLTEETIEAFRAKNGAYPKRIAFTFWGGEYIRTRGLALAQALWALGVRPTFDARGILRDIELVPSEELARPRIDVVAQTSGQFRDAAPSRIELLDRAVRMVANLADEPYPNYAREHTLETQAVLREQGFIESEAAELATARVFGATRSLNYGTGIRNLIERSDRWSTRAEIADQYLLNMSGVYRGGRVWGTPIKGLFEANLTDADMAIQSRSSNVWGPVKLDHMYEFGTLAAVVREKTGKDLEYMLTDARRKGGERAQTLDEAIRDELQTTIWNKRWLENAIRDDGSGVAAALAKSTQNLFGWSVVGKEGLIDDATWKRTYDTIVQDKYAIGMREYFEKNSPASLAETTAVMLDAARKGLWNASEEDLANLADVHATTVANYGAPCSYNVCGNRDLRDFIVDKLPDVQKTEYCAKIDEAVQDPVETKDVNGMELVETKNEEQQKERTTDAELTRVGLKERLALLVLALIIVCAGFITPSGASRKAKGA